MSALDFHRLGSALLDEGQCIADRVLNAQVIAAVRHVDYEECSVHTAPHCAGVMQHLFHGKRQSTLMTEYSHRKGVSDKNQINSCFVDDACTGIVVCRKCRYWLITALFLEECAGGDFERRNHCVR